MIKRSDKRGMALLMVLTFTAMAVAFGVELNRKVRSFVETSAAVRNKVYLSCIAQSGISIGMSILLNDKQTTEIDCLTEDWANPEIIESVINEMHFDRGNLSVKITDEMGKIQVNSLVNFPSGAEYKATQRKIWLNFFNYALMAYEDQPLDITSNALTEAAKDWLDFNDADAITGLNGAESEYYKQLDPPFLPADGPIRDINELSLIKGFDPILLYGIDNIEGAISLFTVYGETKSGSSFTFLGKININTAAPRVLASFFPEESKYAAGAIYTYRNELIENKSTYAFSDINWYKQAPGCSEIIIDASMITDSSDVFSIESTGTIGKSKEKITALILREKSSKTGNFSCRILQYYTEV